ncbi:hypothetical protein L484_009067 [Morus notabilis]|uniref:Uncharacterized protein n=1 Tax=Morus notabilis TaxID=981085 RepID=W9QLV7_9ROSA|nr:hypothetical protein L484_009067 [Morus notabilis]
MRSTVPAIVSDEVSESVYEVETTQEDKIQFPKRFAFDPNRSIPFVSFLIRIVLASFPGMLAIFE